jgi:hypothetical protein
VDFHAGREGRTRRIRRFVVGSDAEVVKV